MFGGIDIQKPEKKRKNLLASIGIVLAIAGIDFMAVFKGLIGSNLTILSTIVVVFSVTLLFTGQKLGYIAVPNGDAGLIFLYSTVTLILSLFSKYSLMQNGYGFVYQAAGFAQIWLLWNINIEDDLDYYVEVGCWLCGVFCTAMLVLLLSTGSLFVNTFSSDSGDQLFTRSTIGALAFKTYVMSLAYQPKSKAKNQLRLCFLLISIVVLIASTRRGAYLAALVCTLLHFRNNRQHMPYIDIDKLFKKGILIGILFAALLLIYNKFDFVQEAVGHSIDSLARGLRTFLGLEDSDMAAAMRVSTASHVLDQYLFHSDARQILFGRGYMTTWVDMPFIQAFWDLGAFGGIAFAVIQFLVPLRYLLRKPERPGTRAAQYLTLMSIVEGIASGYPYGRFFNIMLLITTSLASQTT